MNQESSSIPSGPKCDRDDALAVVRRLREAGHVAYFAGGCVRDTLMGLTPKDFDVATDAPPNRVRSLFSNTQAVGAAFGVILVRQRGSQIEVATFRSDGAYEDGRRPAEVHFTNAEEDAKRRDFTINGLFMDPLDGDRVIDYVGGVEDLKAGRLRAIGNADERFGEDHLRLLRAVRFAARFDLDVESATAAAITRHADELRRISQERVAAELRAMLTPNTRARAWPMLWEFGLLPVIFRFLDAVRVAAPDVRFDPSRSVFLALTPDRSVGFGVALAAGVVCFGWQRAGDVSLHVEKKSAVRAVAAMRDGLKISNEEEAEMRETLLEAGAVIGAGYQPLTLARKKRFLALPTARASRDLLLAIASATGNFADRIRDLEAQWSDLEQLGDFAPTPFVNGNDLVAAGLNPGPPFKRALDAAYDAQLEDRVTTKEQALALALDIARGEK